MAGSGTWLGVGVPRGWGDVVGSGVVTAVVGFVTLLLKEWLETREWDVPACAVDGACVGGGMLLLSVVLKLTKA